MSETESYMGRLYPLGIPKGTIQEQVDFIERQGYKISYEDGFIESKDIFCYAIDDFHKRQWFRVLDNKKVDPYESVFEANRGLGGLIHYSLRYSNGGCCFEEALEEAIDNLEKGEK